MTDNTVMARIIARADECQRHAEASHYPKACSEYRAKEAAFREAAKMVTDLAQPRAAMPDREAIARVLHVTFKTENMARDDWDSSATLGRDNAWRKRVYAGADAILALQPAAQGDAAGPGAKVDGVCSFCGSAPKCDHSCPTRVAENAVCVYCDDSGITNETMGVCSCEAGDEYRRFDAAQGEKSLEDEFNDRD